MATKAQIEAREKAAAARKAKKIKDDAEVNTRSAGGGTRKPPSKR